MAHVPVMAPATAVMTGTPQLSVAEDAAMTLAKKHYQRLWYPQPGSGGDIASRAEHGLTKEEFDAAIPDEFWREVVDRAIALRFDSKNMIAPRVVAKGADHLAAAHNFYLEARDVASVPCAGADEDTSAHANG